MSLSVIIDHRENALHCHENLWECKPTRQNLNVGDIQFVDNNSQTIFCVERKTISDLADSIKNGRYREQKYRLLKSYPANMIGYLIEGHIPSISTTFQGITWKTIMGVILNLQLRDNINVFTSQNPEESVEILKMLQKKLTKGLSNQNQTTSDKEYHHHTGISKKSQLTPEMCFKIQLSQIPAVSHNIADKIVEMYPTLPKLILAFQKEGPDLLKTLIIGKGSEKRKASQLGSKRSHKIFDFLGLK